MPPVTLFLFIANIFQFLANLGDIVYPPLGIFVTFWTLRRRSEDHATISSTLSTTTDSEPSPTSIDLESAVIAPEETPENWVKTCRTFSKEILESLNDILKKGVLDGIEMKKRLVELIDMQESLGVTVSNLARRVKDGIDLDIRRNTLHDLMELEQAVDDFTNSIERSRLNAKHVVTSFPMQRRGSLTLFGGDRHHRNVGISQFNQGLPTRWWVSSSVLLK